VDNQKIKSYLNSGLEWCAASIFAVGFTSFVIATASATLRPFFASRDYLDKSIPCVTASDCAQLTQYLSEFEADTGVRIQFLGNDRTADQVQKIGDYTTKWFKEDTKLIKAWIITYSKLYPGNLKYINVYSSMKKVGGNYDDSIRVINTNLQDPKGVLIHELGHAFTPLDTIDQQVNAFEYFYGPGLKDLRIDHTQSGTEYNDRGETDYILSLKIGDKRNINFSKLLSVAPESRIQTLRNLKANLFEISSVPMEKFYTDSLQGFEEYEVLEISKLKQLVLLSRGNKAYLTDDFLFTIWPLTDGTNNFDLERYKSELDKYFESLQNPVVSEKLVKYYEDAIRLGLIPSS
jgi:hypothetical protein